jgi:DNA (cytosine-5)-methyltransferase 1
MREIILLDGCTCAGGAAYGYYKAAEKLGIKIHVVGVDCDDKKTHPPIPGYEFIKDDLISFLHKNIKNFTHLHASPPCQEYSPSTQTARNGGKVYKDILEAVQNIYRASHLPSVIENVPQAPLRPDVVLRGDMFGLKILKKRHFETNNFFMMNPCRPVIKGSVRAGDYATVVGHGSKKTRKGSADFKHQELSGTSVKDIWQYASGNFWMTDYKDLSESIPWVYTEYIGEQFFKNHK